MNREKNIANFVNNFTKIMGEKLLTLKDVANEQLWQWREVVPGDCGYGWFFYRSI